MIKAVSAPPGGLFRVGRAPDPLAFSEPLPPEVREQPESGNRFDSPWGNYRVLYFGTDLRVCFGETLGRLPPARKLRGEIEAEWQALGFMPPGHIAADWRHRRLGVRVTAPKEAMFLDVEAAGTVQVLRKELVPFLATYGYKDLDLGLVRGPDRRITRAISYWAWAQTDDSDFGVFAGVRYLSRLNDEWECWAVFDDVKLQQVELFPILSTMPELVEVANHFGIRVF